MWSNIVNRSDAFYHAVEPAISVAHAVEYAVESGRLIGFDLENDFRRDFDLPVASVKKQALTDYSALDVKDLGQMWPEGLPVGFPYGRNSVPTEKAISRLPSWAQVALAARCARRVYAIIETWYGDKLKEKDSILFLITRAEECAAIYYRLLHGPIGRASHFPSTTVHCRNRSPNPGMSTTHPKPQ